MFRRFHPTRLGSLSRGLLLQLFHSGMEFLSYFTVPLSEIRSGRTPTSSKIADTLHTYHVALDAETEYSKPIIEPYPLHEGYRLETLEQGSKEVAARLCLPVSTCLLWPGSLFHIDFLWPHCLACGASAPLSATSPPGLNVSNQCSRVLNHTWIQHVTTVNARKRALPTVVQ